jgi:quercetin dioxygenase-like cupin family protein
MVAQMLSGRPLPYYDDLTGVMYDFELAGDVLAKHAHTESNNHITIVARGKVKITSDNWEREAVAGQILDFVANEPHEFVALEDNTRIININTKLGGAPNDYLKA